MSYDYKGTKITGTSTTGKVFSKSGIKKAKKGDKYLNTKTGHVYTCSDAGSTGKADVAKWKYVRTDIVDTPSVSVSNLGAPVRQTGSRIMKATWKTPSAMIDPKKGDRATGLNISWFLGIKGKDPKRVKHTGNEKLTQSSINLNNLKIGKKTYTRESFYPFDKKPKLHYVTVKVRSTNSKGKGASTKSTREFKTPKAPTISNFEFNDVGELSCTITTDAGTGYAERYDTRYKMTVYYSNTKKTDTIYDKNTTKTSKPLVFDDRNYASREYGDYAKVKVKAWARGFKGNSEVVEKTFYISYPAKAQINNLDISSKNSSGKCVVYITTNHKEEHPVDRVKLEVLVNSPYAEASQIPADAGWEETDIIDDAQCNALAIPVADLMPEAGNYTWIRLKTYHANETVLHRYSDYRRVKELETPAATALDDEIKIVSATAGEDGQSAIVNLVWDDGAIASTGTELSWDTKENAWKSTKDPSTYEFTWTDGSQTVDGTTWPNSATIVIKDLEEGEKYYVKARRYNEGDTTTYSEYSNFKTVVTSEQPESVTAVVDRYVAKGSDLNVYWTFAGNGLQKKWQILDSNGTTVEKGQGSLGSAQISSTRLNSLAVNGSITFTVQVSTGSEFVVSEEYTVTIIDKPTLAVTAPATMTSQSGYSIGAVASVPSDLVVVITSQGSAGRFPVGLLRQTAGDTIYSDVYTPEWTANYVLTTDTEYLDKTYYERSGNTYTVVVPESEGGVVDPTTNPSSEGWYEEGTGVATTIALPPQLDFWDLGRYELSVVAIDRQTELHSEPSVSDFSVAWSHQAPSIEPTLTYTLSDDTSIDDNKNYYSYDSTTQTYSVVEPEGTEDPTEEGWYEVSTTEYVTITPIDTTDDNGYHHMAAQINLTPPPNYAETDVYDIYRLTGDGAKLIGEGFPLTYTATDEYAPFSEDGTQHYRIAVRTADGDISFSDIEYVLQGEGIRVDWEGGFIEYPYSVSISDAYKKDVEIRKHLDGGINGYWNEGVQRTGSLNTEAIKIIQQEDIDLTRQLARYTGPVFIRTREGTAFEADLQITDLSTKNIAVMSIAMDASEIDLTDEYMLPIPFMLEDSE